MSAFKSIATVAAAIATMTIAAAPAFADRVDARQARQADRIQDGLRDGSLTRLEAARLKAEQSRIAALERQAERDGYLSSAERARLAAAQRAASRNIYEERHDAQNRSRGWRRWGRHNGRSVFNDYSVRTRRWW